MRDMNRLSDDALKKLRLQMGEQNVLENEPLAPYMSMKVGGPANYLIKPQNINDIQMAAGILDKENVPYYIIGNGSNIIVRDEGFDGAVIRLLDNFSEVQINGNVITASAGVTLKTLAGKAYEASLTGLEFASGIPGSLGGALTMNAGAYGGEMKNVVKSITAMQRDGTIKQFTADEADMGYRHTVFSEGDYIILQAEIELEKGDRSKIAEVMDDLEKRRAGKQPLEYPSCGSVFKRPEGFFAGKLIMDSGLKGARIGGASVSAKHCGFVINDGGGTAKDVLDLIEYIKKVVKEKQGVDLECEIRVL